MGNRVEWSDLPDELWPAIGARLNTTIDLLRFRSICKLWRSALPLPPFHTLSFSLSSPQTPIPLGKSCLTHSKFYRLEPSSSHGRDAAADPSISSSKGWLIKVGEPKPGPLRLLDPFTNFRVSFPRRRYASDNFPNVLNLMDFRIVELIEAYSLNYSLLDDEDEDGVGLGLGVSVPVRDVRKVVLFPGFSRKEVGGGRMVFVLYQDGRLSVSKIGDQNWTIVNDGSDIRCDDIILHKGQLYVVHRWGTILWIDCSSLKLVQFSPPLFGFGKRKHLVESGGSLYVVDMYIEGEPDNPMGLSYEVIDIRVYKLDEEWGRWLDIKDLGDCLFVLGKDSNFSLSAKDYHGCDGNCIYFCGQGSACVFRLDGCTFKSPNLFWPCPTLFHPKFNSKYNADAFEEISDEEKE